MSKTSSSGAKGRNASGESPTATEMRQRALLERLEFALESGDIGIYETHREANQEYYSPGYLQQLGYRPGEWSNSVLEWSTRIHPDDYDRITDGEWLRAPVDASQYVYEYRMRHKDGSYRWILDRGKIVERDAGGRCLSAVGTHIDITLGKEVEAELLRAKEQAETANRALQSVNAELTRLATTDALTGVWNRRHFEQVVDAEIARSMRYFEPLSLLLIDIDHFKSINDRYGHQTGDEVLIEVTRLLQQNIRAMDVLARWGGEEFVLMLPHCGAAEALHLAEKLRLILMGKSFLDVGALTASFGVAELRHEETLETWLKRADEALYAAKRDGRNLVRLSTS